MDQFIFQGTSEDFNITGDVGTLTYGSHTPTTIIDGSKEWQVVIRLRTTGANSSIITGNWHFEAYFENMLGESEGSIGEAVIPLTPGPSPIDYGPIKIKVYANTMPPGLYRISVVVRLIDPGGKPSPIVGFTDDLILQLFESDIPISELPDDVLIQRAEMKRVLSALESSGTVWNTIDDVSKETGLSLEQVKKSIDALGVHVLRDRSRYVGGRELYTTRGRARRELKNVGKDLDIRTAAENALSTGGGVSDDPNKAYERIVGSTASVLQQLEINYNQAREQAKGQYRLSIGAGAIGIALIGVAVVGLLLGYVPTAIVSAISSLMLDSMAAFFFLESRKASERVDSITAMLNETREIHALVEIVDTISDEKSRDKLKADIVKKALTR